MMASDSVVFFIKVRFGQRIILSLGQNLFLNLTLISEKIRSVLF